MITSEYIDNDDNRDADHAIEEDETTRGSQGDHVDRGREQAISRAGHVDEPEICHGTHLAEYE